MGNNDKAASLAVKALTKDNTSTAARDAKELVTLLESIKKNLVREEAAQVREETNLSAINTNPATTITESPVVAATPQIWDDTANVRVKLQNRILQQM